MVASGPSAMAWAVLAGLILLTGLAGCTQPQPVEWNRQALRDEPFSVNSPALVLGGGSIQRDERNPEPRYGTPWWVGRSDDRLGVRSGPLDQVDEAYEVYTNDRQSTSGDHVRDHYQRTYRSVRYGRIYR